MYLSLQFELCVYIHVTLLSLFLCARHWSKNCINYCLCAPQISELYPYCIWGNWGTGDKTEVTEESIKKILSNIRDLTTYIIEKSRGHNLVTRQQEHEKIVLASGMGWSGHRLSVSVISLAQPFLCVSSISWLASHRITRGLPSSARATGFLIYVWGERIIFTTLPHQEWKIPFHHISYKKQRKNFACSLSVIKKTTSISLKPEKKDTVKELESDEWNLIVGNHYWRFHMYTMSSVNYK